MYHAIGTAIADDAAGLYTLTPAQFRAQMRCLAEGGGDIVPLYPCGPAGGGKAITFDDGYLDNLRVAAPILAELGFPFTVFVTSDNVRGGPPIYLGRVELEELARFPGATIGAHGASHKPLTRCSDADLSDELRRSRAVLEDIVQRPVDLMSYPHGAVDRRVRDAAREAGYRVAAGSRFGTNRPNGQDPLALRRTDVWQTDRIDQFVGKLNGDWDWLGWRRWPRYL